MPPRPKRLRQSPRKQRLYIDEDTQNVDEPEGKTLTKDPENKHPNNSRSPEKRPRDADDDTMVEKEIVEVAKLTTDGWAIRWKALMKEHSLNTSNALAEMLVKAYDACSCRIQSENTTEPQQDIDTATLENTAQGNSTTNSLHQSSEDNSTQRSSIKCTFTCVVCNKTLPTKTALLTHINTHTKPSKPVTTPLREQKTAVEESDYKNGQDTSDLNTTVDSNDQSQTLEKENEAVGDLSQYAEDVNSEEIIIKKQSRVARKDDATGEVIGEIVISGKGETKRKIRLKRERGFTCEHCGKTFNTSQLLKFHVRTHTGERPLECKVCGKTFIDHKALQVHSRIHSGVRPYSCPHCRLTFTQSANLKRHIASVHDKNKQYLCQFCDARFARLEHLKTHERSHMGIKPFKCIICSQEFATKQHLQRHAVIHTGFLPFSCSFCPRTFNRKDRLLKHEADHKTEGLIEKVEISEQGESPQITNPRLDSMGVTGLTCCIMTNDEEDKEEENQTEPEETTPKHILQSIRIMKKAPSPKSTPKIPISRDPSGRRDPIYIVNEPQQKLQKSESPMKIKNDPSCPQIPDAPSTARLETINTPSIGQTMSTGNGDCLSNTVAQTFTVAPKHQNATSNEQTVEYVTYADANQSQQALLEAVLSASGQESRNQQHQQHQQQHQQQQVVYYKQVDSGNVGENVVELSPGNYSSMIEPVLYQQEVEVQAEPAQQHVYVVQGADGEEGERMIIADGGDMEPGVQYVFQAD